MRRSAFFISCLVLTAGCGGPSLEVKASRYLMGTELSAAIRTKDRPAGLAALDRAFQEVERLESLLSNWRPDSEISLLCSQGFHKPVPLSPDTVECLKAAFGVARESEGAFHPALGPLLDLWGFYRAPSDTWTPPDRTSIDRALALSDWKTVRLEKEGRRWRGRLEGPGPKIDLGGIGKGYALDEAAKTLREMGVREGVLNFGGNLLLLGRPKAPLEVPLRSPSGIDGEYWELLFLPYGSLSVSGNYEKFREWKGKRYGHILDPRTGRPTESEGCVAVWAKTAAQADAWSTAFWVMGPEKALPLAEKKDLEVLFLLKENGRWVEHASSGFKALQHQK